MSVPSRRAITSADVAAADAQMRASLLARGQGLISETMPRALATNASQLMIGGTVYFVSLPLLAGDLISAIHLIVATAGVAMTLSKVGLYSAASVLLASSADQGAAWQTVGQKSAAVTSPYSVTASGLYYLAAIGAGGTLPILNQAAVSGGVVAAIGSGALPYGSQAGQVDLPANATIAAAAAVARVPWFGAS